MDVIDNGEAAVSKIASAIGEPARARILYCLMDGHARTSTELAVVAQVSPSTASVHLSRLNQERLVNVQVQGKHRYYGLAGPDVARVLEGLHVLAGVSGKSFAPSTPSRLRAARTCYDHMAGTVGVLLHNSMHAMGWVRKKARAGSGLRSDGGWSKGFEALGIDVEGTRALRRRFVYGCLDWSERRPHLGGSAGRGIVQDGAETKLGSPGTGQQGT